ncbi:autotransporter outer membrane beta-barrel domain-containing protein [Candidatus Bartonella raoultii]|uniref:Autotransporter outer membrane beta-barrel domain-containing protein n=2 Tax=Bartonella raoultii TaxID=1457020 RepID=A0ABS7I3F5_9HYPH|nr:autotransporter outer membrane beta-barrel domain-containing protein [Bartonella raoultii]
MPSHPPASQLPPKKSENPVEPSKRNQKTPPQNTAGKPIQSKTNSEATKIPITESSSPDSPTQGMPSHPPASQLPPKKSENPVEPSKRDQKTPPQNTAEKPIQSKTNSEATKIPITESSSPDSPTQGMPSHPPASQLPPKKSENPVEPSKRDQKTPPQNTAEKPIQSKTNSESTKNPITESSSPDAPTQRMPSHSSTSIHPPSAKLEIPIKLVPKVQAEWEKPILSESKALENPVQIAEPSTNISIKNGTTLTQQNAKIYDRYFAVHVQGENSVLTLKGGTVTSGFVGLSASGGGRIDATAITATAVSVGLVSTNSTIILKDSTVNVTGGYDAYGIFFYDLPHPSERRHARSAERSIATLQEQKISNSVILENTKVSVEQGIGVGATIANGEIILKSSEIYAALLSSNGDNKSSYTNTLTLTADHSLLKGGARTLGESKTVFTLQNGTKWLLTPHKNFMNNESDILEHEQFNVDKKLSSQLSKLSLTESTILFAPPTQRDYQTLFVGFNPQTDDTSQATTVYSAEGDARIYLNTQWSPSSPVAKQETDRLVINGNVSGTTMLHIHLVESEKSRTNHHSVWTQQMHSLPLSTHGVSVVQVSGNANENSFALAGGYMTIGHEPYKYVLKAYGPGKSHENQNLFGQNGNNFWDFRLQNDYLDSDKKIRALLPQVANYLVMPNALFSSGLADINNQNTLLDNMRIKVFGAEKKKENSIFFSSYGEKITLSSNHDPLHYGYGADVNYGAVQMGTILAALEGTEMNTYLGLLGTYGKIAFTPKGMKDSEKTTLNKWSLTAYSGIQHNNGLYINTFLSYGILKGNVTTKLIGNAATLDDTKTLSVSTTMGKQLETGVKDLTFEPQVQFVYQNLMFDIISDANNLEVDMGNPRQWLVRIGGRLTQTLMDSPANNTFSFYGKVNVLKAFGDGGTIQIADPFSLDPIGSSLEGGLGINAQFSQKIALHGDVSYRQKLQKAGVSGTHISGGIHYRF